MLGNHKYLVLLLVIGVILVQDSLEKLLSFAARRLLIKHSRLDDLFVHVEFVARGRKNTLLHRVDRHQSQYAHFVLLPDTMSSILSLQILES